MSAPDQHAESLAQAFRSEFDESFGRPRRVAVAAPERFALVRVGAARYAVRLGDLRGLHALQAVTPLPGQVPHRLGLCGIGGRLVPIFDLAGLLGQGDPGRTPRIALLDSRVLVGLACDELLGHLDASSDRIRPVARGDEATLTDAIVEAEGGAIPVLCLQRIAERILPGKPDVEGR